MRYLIFTTKNDTSPRVSFLGHSVTKTLSERSSETVNKVRMEELLSKAKNAKQFEPPDLRKLRERRKANMGLARITKFVFNRKKGPKLSSLANANNNPSTTDHTFQRTSSSERVRKFEGEFARALSGVGDSGCVPRKESNAVPTKKIPGLPLDLSGWHLDLLVNKLQGRHYIQQRLVITPQVIAIGCMGASTGRDHYQLKLSMKVCAC